MTLTTLFPQCQDLQTQVEAILQLLQQEPTLRSRVLFRWVQLQGDL